MATNFIFPELGSALLLTGGRGWIEGLEKLGSVWASFHISCSSDVCESLGGKDCGWYSLWGVSDTLRAFPSSCVGAPQCDRNRGLRRECRRFQVYLMRLGT